MRKLYLIRHGRPDIPQGKRLCLGRADIPLGTLGRMQACLLGQELEGRVSRVFSSPLSRAVQTAEGISREVTVLDGLTELSAGDWDGLDFDEIARRWPALYAARGANPNLPIPGAEDAAAGQQRFLAAVRDALEASAGDIAIAAHISVNQLLLCQGLGISPYEARQFRLPYGSYCELAFDDRGGFTVESVGRLPRPVLTPELAEKLLLAAAPGEQVTAHSRAVAKEALRIAGALPLTLDKALLESAALLHDIARSQPEHALLGSQWLRELGYDRAAELVESHHDWESGSLDERAILYIADKCVREDRRVRLEERFEGSAARCKDREALEAHRRRYDAALALKEEINRLGGQAIIE
ncbi:MAG: histidine phosphatase family protein [Candidatus Limivicinus sp.]